MVGVRPEHVQLATNDNTSFIVEVDNVEILGTETLLTFQMGDKQWMAKWNGQWNIKVGERVPIFIDPKHLFLFDSDTGSCLHYEPSTEDLTVKGHLYECCYQNSKLACFCFIKSTRKEVNA